MKTVCGKNQCTGCMACVEACGRQAIKIQDKIKFYNAVIDETICVNCEKCYSVCQKNSGPILSVPLYWYQGWAQDKLIRDNASSGGAATTILKTFLDAGGYVCSCLFQDGDFKFVVTNKSSDLHRFTGSKYIKINPQSVYSQIKQLLMDNMDVLFLGLPCQVAAIKKFLGDNLQSKLFTVDLICHGTPSPQLLPMYLEQHKYDLRKIGNITFRKKSIYGLNIDSKEIAVSGICDRYTISFLKGLNYTENCYSCAFAQVNRVSDLTLGDSWGSDLPTEEKKKGISLILCQTERGQKLLAMTDMHLESVDATRSINANKQLRAPSNNSKKHLFFKLIFKGKNFDYAVFRCLPEICIKQDVKYALIKIGLLNNR